MLSEAALSEAATEWWIKVKAPRPGADYRWLRLSSAAAPAAAPAGAEPPEAPPDAPAEPPGDLRPDLPSPGVRAAIAAAAPLGGTGELTIVLLVGPDGAPALYVEGLHAPSWPADHQGRTITASVVGRAADGGQAGPLARALWAVTHPTAARQAALERVVRFGAGERPGAGAGGAGEPPGSGAGGAGEPPGAGGAGEPPGAGGSARVAVDAAAWQRFLRTVNRLPTPHPSDLGAGRRGSGQVALENAVRDAVPGLLGGSVGYLPPPAPRLLLAVSPLLDDEWCARHQPWWAIGPELPAHRSLGQTRHHVQSVRGAAPAKSGAPALPGWAQVGHLLRAVFPMLALAVLCSAVVLIIL